MIRLRARQPPLYTATHRRYRAPRCPTRWL